MAMSDYLTSIRQKIGSQLLLTPGVAALIYNEHGHILLQRRGDNNQWSLPGGGVDPGETPADAIIREVKEETGLIVKPTKIVAVVGGAEHMRFTYPNGDQIEVVATLFLCEVIAGTLSTDGDESLELKYFDLNNVPPLFPCYPKEILSHNKATAYFNITNESEYNEVM